MVIECLLQYFFATDHILYWDLTIEPNCLEQWPTEGNMLDCEGVEEVVEVPLPGDDTNSHSSSTQCSAANPTSASTATYTTTSTDAKSAASYTTATTAATDAEAEDISPDLLLADGDERGPAPLQSDMQPEDTFEGLMHIGTGTLTSHNDVDVADQALNLITNNISSRIAGNDAPAPDFQYNDDQQASTVAQQDLLLTGSFVQMGVAPFSWTLSFPTVLQLSYVDVVWVILGDRTAYNYIRGRKVKKADWYNWLMWWSEIF